MTIIGVRVCHEAGRDHLLAATLAQETEKLSRYIPEKHTDFDADHIWAVTMGRS